MREGFDMKFLCKKMNILYTVNIGDAMFIS